MVLKSTTAETQKVNMDKTDDENGAVPECVRSNTESYARNANVSHLLDKFYVLLRRRDQ